MQAFIQDFIGSFFKLIFTINLLLRYVPDIDVNWNIFEVDLKF